MADFFILFNDGASKVLLNDAVSRVLLNDMGVVATIPQTNILLLGVG